MSSKPSMPEIEIAPGGEGFADRAAEHFSRLAIRAVADQGRFCAALSGGSTPMAMYTRLARPPYASLLNWKKIHLFWGDERCVPPDHPESNYGAARPVLLEALPIPADNIHRIPGELGPDQASKAYEKLLRRFFDPAPFPVLDLVLLGLGDDGHTASLFPGSSALKEKKRWAVGVEHEAPPPPLVPRVTLTLPVINAALNILFLVTGAGKAKRLAQVLRQPPPPDLLPAQKVCPETGRLVWLVDEAAALELH